MGKLNSKIIDLARGAAAGALATMAMKGVSALLESRDMRTKEAFSDSRSAERELVDRFNRRTGDRMSGPDRAVVARGLKWAVGIGSGMIGSYISRQFAPQFHPFRSAALSAATFVLFDEVLKPAIGIQPGPRQIPLKTHLAGLAGHAAYGLVNAGVQKATKRTIPRRFQRVGPSRTARARPGR